MNAYEAYAAGAASQMTSAALNAVLGPGPNRERMPAYTSTVRIPRMKSTMTHPNVPEAPTLV